MFPPCFLERRSLRNSMKLQATRAWPPRPSQIFAELRWPSQPAERLGCLGGESRRSAQMCSVLSNFLGQGLTDLAWWGSLTNDLDQENLLFQDLKNSHVQPKQWPTLAEQKCRKVQISQGCACGVSAFLVRTQAKCLMGLIKLDYLKLKPCSVYSLFVPMHALFQIFHRLSRWNAFRESFFVEFILHFARIPAFAENLPCAIGWDWCPPWLIRAHVPTFKRNSAVSRV